MPRGAADPRISDPPGHVRVTHGRAGHASSRSAQPDRSPGREPATAASAGRPDPRDPQAPEGQGPRQAAVDRRPSRLPRLAAAPRARPARDRRRVAPPRLAIVLALALPVPAGPPRLSPEVRD